MKKRRPKKNKPGGPINRALNRARTMPPLAHNGTNGQPFDIMRSDVAAWLCLQPEFRQAMFNFASNRHAIVYDKATQTWKGADA